MKSTRKPWHHGVAYPQPLSSAGARQPEHFREQAEHDAAREWLRHVEAGRIGPEHRE